MCIIKYVNIELLGSQTFTPAPREFQNSPHPDTHFMDLIQMQNNWNKVAAGMCEYVIFEYIARIFHRVSAPPLVEHKTTKRAIIFIATCDVYSANVIVYYTLYTRTTTKTASGSYIQPQTTTSFI